MSMAPERERYIREFIKGKGTAGIGTELLAEIDQLRSDLHKLGKDKESNDNDYLRLSSQLNMSDFKLKIVEEALQWEEKRCGRLHGPLGAALTELRKK